MTRTPPTDLGVLRETLRSLAENARSVQPTWWLWDEDATAPFEYGPMLGFAHAATPEAILALTAPRQHGWRLRLFLLGVVLAGVAVGLWSGYQIWGQS